jgi:hypothetical protein
MTGAGLIAAIFTLSYLSSGVPALIAGITAEQYGLHGTALVYSAAVAGLAAAAGTFLTRHGSRTAKPHPAAAIPPPAAGPAHHGAVHASRARGNASRRYANALRSLLARTEAVTLVVLHESALREIALAAGAHGSPLPAGAVDNAIPFCSTSTPPGVPPPACTP